MSDTAIILKNAAARASAWSPVILRCALWIGLSMLTDLRHSMAEMARQVAEGGKIGGFGWPDALVGMGIAGLLSWRTFLDQTYTRHLEQKKSDTEFLRAQAQQR